MPQALRHALRDCDAGLRTDDAGYTTHGRQSSAAASKRRGAASEFLVGQATSHRAAVRLGCILELQRHGNTRRSTTAGTTGKMAQQPRAARQVLLARRGQLLEDPALGGTSTAK